jgi:hypothetical protein
VSKGHAVDCIKCEVVITYFLFDKQPVDPILKGQLSSSRDLTLEDGTNRLSRNNGNKLPLYTVENPRIREISFTLQQLPEITQHN